MHASEVVAGAAVMKVVAAVSQVSIQKLPTDWR
jgi:hypothetical protein